MVDPKILARVTWLAPANAAAKHELAARSTVRSFRAGAVLWRARSEPRGVFVVLDGEVRVVRAVGGGGRQHVVHTEGPGGTLGEVPLFGGGSYPATAIAARPTTCLVLTRDAILAAIAQDQRVAFVFLARLAQRVRAVIGRLDAVSGSSVPARLAAYLLARSAAASGGTFTLGRSQLEVAEELGTVREVVVRALRTLRAAGFVRSPARGRFAVANEAALRHLAGRPRR